MASDSSKRILAAGKAWHKVLNVALSASADDIKKSYRQLALLHHPDKADGDADIFKKVKEAYEVAMQKCQKRTKLAASPKASSKRKAQTQAQPKTKKAKTHVDDDDEHEEPDGGARKKPAKQARPKPWRLQPGANKARIRKAVDQWQRSEKWQDKTKPEDVQTLLAETLAERLQSRGCIPVDVRDTATATSSLRVRDSVQLTFSMMVASPDEAAPLIESMRETGKHLVLISDEGATMSTCGSVGAILLDVFGFEVEMIRRLEGGYAAWCQWLDANKAIAKELEPSLPAPPSANSKSQPPAAKRAKAKPWTLPSGAAVAKIHKAIELWEQSERWDEKTLPDQIVEVSPEQVADWIRKSECMAVDVRKDPEESCVGVHEAELISFSQLVLSPADVTPRVLKLKDSGKRLVLYSDSCERMDASGLLGALLLDVFGFDKDLVYRIQGGCIAWGQWLESHADEARTLEPLAMRLRRKRAAMLNPPVQRASVVETQEEKETQHVTAEKIAQDAKPPSDSEDDVPNEDVDMEEKEPEDDPIEDPERDKKEGENGEQEKEEEEEEEEEEVTSNQAAEVEKDIEMQEEAEEEEEMASDQAAEAEEDVDIQEEADEEGDDDAVPETPEKKTTLETVSVKEGETSNQIAETLEMLKVATPLRSVGRAAKRHPCESNQEASC